VCLCRELVVKYTSGRTNSPIKVSKKDETHCVHQIYIFCTLNNFEYKWTNVNTWTRFVFVILYKLLWWTAKIPKSKSGSYQCKLCFRDFKKAVSWTKKARDKDVKNVDSIFKQQICTTRLFSNVSQHDLRIVMVSFIINVMYYIPPILRLCNSTPRYNLSVSATM
jgi:hypothetical protein